MYKFLGAVTGRSIMKQGELNQDALLGALIGAIADCVFGI
jgi:hypothetical protein